jgi:hypothetical protein
LNTAAIIVSRNLSCFGQATRALTAQTLGFRTLVVVPWGNRRIEIESATGQLDIETRVVGPDHRDTLEGSRNNALDALVDAPPEWVAFLDDDTTLDPRWLEEMTKAAEASAGDCVFASLVAFSSNPSVVQSAGHVLDDGRPLDCEYKESIQKVRTFGGRLPLCPCGNSAFVPWRAITKIRAWDEQIWDPRFRQWQTCFDFGLKLRLVGFNCQLVTDALATHAGACVFKESLNEQQVIGQLRSRVLLYDKFYPEGERHEVTGGLREKVHGKWREEGYPSARWLKGEQLITAFETSVQEEVGLRQDLNGRWLDEMARLAHDRRRRLLFGR